MIPPLLLKTFADYIKHVKFLLVLSLCVICIIDYVVQKWFYAYVRNWADCTTTYLKWLSQHLWLKELYLILIATLILH